MEQLNLNKNQLSAVKHNKGPLLIIAGAGTGKTTVITQRIKYLITSKNIPPDQILALTFTEKASYEMQERVDVLLPYGYTNLWINTFHSFCDRILREESHNIGLDPNYKLLSEGESILFLTQNIFNLDLRLYRPLGNPTKFLEGLLKHFSRLKDEDISPKEYFKYSRKFETRPASQKLQRGENSKFEEKLEDIAQTKELANAYQKYEKLKVKNSLMDFSDLLSNTLLLFRKRPNILKKYQKQFKFILVDEFQDTNFAQNELAILLAGDDKNITVVADDDQSIYRFRGAAVSNVTQFKKTYKNAKIITLTDNYRSTQEILDASYRLIQHNNPNRLEVVEKINKKLISHFQKPGRPIELIKEKRSEDEADEIAQKIIELSKHYEYREIAVLVRANNHSQGVASALGRRRIPYQFLGPGYLFSQEEIKDLISYITFLTNLGDSVSLFRVLSMDVFDISPVDLNFLLNFAKKRNITLFEALYSTNQTYLNSKTMEKFLKIRNMTEDHLKRSKKEKAGQILYYFLVDSGLFETLGKIESAKEEKRVQNIAKFFDRIKKFEEDRPDANIFTLSDWLSLMLQMGESPRAADIDLTQENAVNILTVHSSKGLEFSVVFLVNLVNDRFPSRERKEKIPVPEGLIKENLPKNTNFHLEEERRLFYVGMTRAKERLFFTAADFYAEGKRKKKLSPFIYEALPDLKIKQEETEKLQQLQLSEALSAYQTPQEESKKIAPYKVRYITFSNLQMFDICPLHYRAKVILKIPTPTSSVQSFGISLHNTLYKFYKEAEGKKLSFGKLIKILDGEWINEGYQSKVHEKERFFQAKKILKEFYASEKPFKIPLRLEIPFSFMLEGGVKVFGKIDRVDKAGKGIEIIDYKTGEDNPKADKAHRLQLAMYALAATKVRDPVLNRHPGRISVAIHFLEGNKRKSMNFTKDDLGKLENDLLDKIKEIEQSDFLCSKNILCKNCEYKMLCSTN